MTLTLNLTPDVEAALNEAALQKGLTREELAAEALRLVYLPEAPNEDDALNAKSIAAVQEALGDRGMLLEDYRREVQTKRQGHTQSPQVAA